MPPYVTLRLTWRPAPSIDASMGTVIASLAKAVAQIGDPVVLRVLAKSLLWTLAIFVVGGGIMLVSLYRALINVGFSWSAEISGVAAVLITLLAGRFLFRVVALAVLQFFADDIVRAVEQRHYPAACATARQLPFREDLSNSVRGIGRALGFNLLAAPIALVLLFTAIGPAIVFLLVNAVLLGRELTDMAWLRQCQPGENRPAASALDRLMLGGAVAGIMLVPFANLFAPVIGAAAGTHLTHRALGTPSSADGEGWRNA